MVVPGGRFSLVVDGQRLHSDGRFSLVVDGQRCILVWCKGSLHCKLVVFPSGFSLGILHGILHGTLHGAIL